MQNKIVKICIAIIVGSIVWVTYHLTKAEAGQYERSIKVYVETKAKTDPRYRKAAAYNQQIDDYKIWEDYQKWLKEDNLRIQREKKRVNSFNRNRQVERQPSNPRRYALPPPSNTGWNSSGRSSMTRVPKSTRRIGRSTRR